MDRINRLRPLALTLVPLATWTSWPVGLALALAAVATGRGRHAVPTALVVVGGALALVYLLAGLLGSSPTSGAAGALAFAAFAGSVGLAMHRREPSDALWLGRGFLFAVAVQAIFSMAQVAAGLPRAHGTMFHPNAVGSAVAVASVLALVLAVRGASRPDRLLSWGAMIAGLGVLAASQSRGAWIAVVVGMMAVLLAISVRRTAGSGRRSVRRALLAAAALLLLLLASIQFWQLRLPSVASPLDLEGRTILWRETLTQVTNRPWLGHGWGRWSDVIAAADPNIRTYAMPNSHNQLLEWLFEVGTFGTALWLWWLVVLVRPALRQHEEAHVLAAVGVVVAVAVHGMVEAVLSMTYLALPLGLLLAALTPDGRDHDPK